MLTEQKMTADEHPLDGISRSSEVCSVVKAALSKGVLSFGDGDTAGISIFGAEGSLHAVIISELFTAMRQTLVVAAPSEREASDLAGDIEALRAARKDGSGAAKVVMFPAWGTMPYRELSVGAAVFGERAAALAALAGDEPVILLTAERAFLTPVPPPDYFKNLLTTIEVGDSVDTAALSAKLISYGYTRVTQVQLHGEFVSRGEVLDIFMSGDDLAYRLTFDFDKVASIKRFDPVDQSGGEQAARFVVRPMKEVVWDDTLIEALEKGPWIQETDAADEKSAAWRHQVFEALIEKGACPGEELLYPAVFGEKHSLFDYAEGRRFIPVYLERERLSNADDSIKREYQNSYRNAMRERLVPPPETLLLGFAETAARAGGAVSFFSLKLGIKDEAAATPVVSKGELVNIACDPARSFFGNIDFLRDEFLTLLSQGWKIMIAAESEIQRRRISELLESGGRDIGPEVTQGADGSPPVYNGRYRKWNRRGGAFTKPGGVAGGRPPLRGVPEDPKRKRRSEGRGETGKQSLPSPLNDSRKTLNQYSDSHALSIVVTPLSSGFALPESKLLVVTEAEIFGRRTRQIKSLKTARTEAIDTFVDLEPNDYVVHIQYGIGVFRGIERIRALGRERDYVKLEYAGEETVFVPIEQANLVQRYIGNEGAPPRLDKLGSKSWEGRKSRVKKSVEDIAEHLVALYSKRKAAPGFAFPDDTEWQTMFEAAFPYEETQDQLRCVDEIKADMEAPFPMDRLVCGDVGYGKTEVAVRACFKAVMGGKQIAFLAPTTILAEQHYENFVQRFERFPVKVAMLSRLVDGKTARQVLKAVKEGTVDLLVGTHRIIQKDVMFKDLGLIVVDEEQRFGVKDKEKLKEFKTNVDCLALSATPIPRTLHMSLLKIRDMSLLATPPQNRLPIETTVEEWSEARVVKAIRAEAARGGQVFYLHNRIEDLEETRTHLQSLMPEMLVETAHGRMDSRDLEDVMHRFIHGGFHVLVSTTIIENGIDIPNVNTIIIDRADRYGVSQLYQLRGRVGRSDRLAYAYLFYPKDHALPEVAMKRLQVISDFTELGSGFKIAMKDMEIRGAGNLLGAEQSGDILSVGFDLYLRLLDEAIRKLEDENYSGETETLLELEYSGFIPNEYIDSPQQKMEVYKKIASIRTREECDAITAELVDRFGPLPEEAESLLALAEIRIICRDLAVSSLRERNGLTRVEFSRVSKVNVDRLMRLIKEGGGKVRVDPNAANVILLQTGGIGLKEKSTFLRERLEALSA
jgi:transcription-repair coupling factor (superfamily II helicase)